MTIHEFPMPADVNGEQLKNELNADVVYQVGDTLCIVGNMTKAEAQSALNAHKPLKPTLDDKLASVGLSVVDLKTALGL